VLRARVSIENAKADLEVLLNKDIDGNVKQSVFALNVIDFKIYCSQLN
jgi:hypothetical protein